MRIYEERGYGRVIREDQRRGAGEKGGKNYAA